MHTVTADEIPDRNEAGLRTFLQGVLERVQSTGEAHIASVSLKVPHIAPLAVLQSIYEPNDLHAYVEQPQSDDAIAAMESVCRMDACGDDRFDRVRAFVEDWLERTVCIGDLDTPFSGPHFFTRFNFESDQSVLGFAPATVFLPRWQVAKSRGSYVAVANVRLDPDAQIEPVLQKLWAAYRKFSAYSYTEPQSPVQVDVLGDVAEAPLPAMPYEDWVARALAQIESGALDKVVLARAVEYALEKPLDIFESLNRLRNEYAACFTFSWGSGMGNTFMGATPERLCVLEKGFLQTEALAGSAPRGDTAARDAALAGELLKSDKDRREHAIVTDYIVSELQGLGLEVELGGARLRQLANVQHLHTPISANMGAGLHLLDIVKALHPTPAIAGHPLDVALNCIESIENFQRGPYAGCLGWINAQGEGAFMVALRCALLHKSKIRLFSGAGIVSGSEPSAEMKETDIKLSALSNLLESR